VSILGDEAPSGGRTGAAVVGGLGRCGRWRRDSRERGQAGDWRE
jgi:hypothetical protein